MPVSSELRKAVGAAIFDPGTTEGYKGDRTLTEWQLDAVMRALAAAALDAQGTPDPVFIEAMATEYTRLAWSSAPLSTWPAADRDLIIDRFRQSYLAALAAPQPSTGSAPDA